MHRLKKLNTLECDLFCYLNDGPLKDAVLDNYLDEADAHSDIMEFNFDASLVIKGNAESAAAASITLRLECDEFLYQKSLRLTELDADQRDELLELVTLHGPTQTTPQTSPRKNILRKKQGDNLLNIAQASKALGLSQRQLKTLIPCSEIRISDSDSGKKIEDYYWDIVLIQRLIQLHELQQQGCCYSAEEVSYIAETCCEGDVKWARDTIAIYLKQCASPTKHFT